MKFNFETQEFNDRHKIELEENRLREKLEIIPLQVIVSQIKYDKTLKDSEIFFITLNPPKDCNKTEFINRVHSLVGRSYLPKLRYTFEQRSEDPQTAGEGIHAHILCQKKKGISPKQIINNLESYFKKILSRNSIDIKKYPHSFLDDKIKYMTGDKWDEDKSKKIEVDKIFRDNFKLLPIY